MSKIRAFWAYCVEHLSSESVKTEVPPVEEQQAEKLRLAAVAEVKKTQLLAEKLRSSFEADLGTPLPEPVATDLGRLEESLKTVSESDTAKMESVVESAEEGLVDLDGVVKVLAKYRRIFLANLALLQSRIQAIDAHPKATVDHVKGKVDAIKLAVTEVKKQADGGAYQEADQALLPVAQQCGEVERVADEHANYGLLLADREQRVSALPAIPPNIPVGADVALQQLKDLPKNTLDEAKQLAAANKFAEATSKLKLIPQQCIDATWTLDQAKIYTAERAKLNTSLTNIGLSKGVIQEAVSQEAAVKKMYDDSDYAATQNFDVSMRLIRRGSNLASTVFKDIGLYNKMFDERTKAETAISQLKGHGGVAGISDEINRLNNDFQFGEDKKAAHEYPTAQSVYVNVQEYAAAATLIAEKHETFKADRKVVDDERKVQAARGSTAANDVLAEALTAIGRADSAATARDYDGAAEELGGANELISWAEHILDNALAVVKMKADAQGVLSQADTKPVEAFEKFKEIWDFVNGVVTATFNTDMNNTLAKGQQGKDSSNPGLLLEATQECQDILTLNDQNDAYERINSDLEDRFTDLKQEARDGIFDGDWNAIDQKLTEAKDHGDNRRYPDAQKSLNQALALIVTAEGLTEAWDDYATERPLVQNKIDLVDTVEGQKELKTEVDKLKSDLQATNDLRSQKKCVEANKALATVKADAVRLKDWLDLCKKARTAEKKNITDKIGAIQGKPLVAADLLEVETLKGELAKMFTQRQFQEALNMCRTTIPWRMELATNELERFDAYEVERKKASDAIDELKGVLCELNLPVSRLIQKEYAEAAAMADERNFDPAKERMAAIPARCVEPVKIGKAFGPYDASRKTAAEAIAALEKDFPKLVDLQLTVLKAQMQAALDLASRSDLAGAKTITDAIALSAAEARKTAEAGKGTMDAAQDIGGRSGADGLTTDIQKARVLANGLKGRADTLLKDQLPRIERLLTQAENNATGGKHDPARSDLNEAMSAIVTATSEADEFVQAEAYAKEADDQIKAMKVKYTSPELLVTTLERLEKEMALAHQNSAMGLATASVNLSKSVLGELQILSRLGADHAVYLDERKKVDPRVSKLSESPARFAIAKTIGEIRAYLVEVENQVAAGAYKEAMELLNSAVTLLETAELTASMHENQAVSKDAVKNILSRPNGEKQLDTLIQGLDVAAKRKVCKEALEQRFALKLQIYTDKDGTSLDADPNKDAPDVLRLYEMMAALPTEHTQKNPNLRLIKRLGDKAGTSSYNKYSREVKLQVDRVQDKSEKVIGLESELGPLDSDSTPPPGDPPIGFNWTTLHEIGHAVDDRMGFMKSHAGDPAYGGWREYGSNVSEIAEAAAKHFDFPQAYIEGYLNKQTMPRPEVPSTTDAESWDKLRAQVEAWCDSIREDRSIYYSAAATNRVTLKDGRVYQEAYKGRWVSYLADARKKGVRGYQFRAPGEWFAEVYAAYFSGKMNANHPARKWLKNL